MGLTGSVPRLPEGGRLRRRRSGPARRLRAAAGSSVLADEPVATADSLTRRPSRRTLQGLPVAEEFVVLVVSAEAAADVGEVGDELDLLDPFDLFEAEFDLVAQPQPQRRAVAQREHLVVH